jgi:hypothetical protein
MTKTVKAKDLKPGMEVDEWDRDRGPASTIKSVRVIERQGFKYDVVKVEFEDGSYMSPSPTTVCGIGVKAESIERATGVMADEYEVVEG